MKTLLEESTMDSVRDDVDLALALIDDAGTIEELYNIEDQVGCQDFLGCNDWEQTHLVLQKLHSPFAGIYYILGRRWEELMSEAMERTRIAK